jgi:hypothetical protein
MITYLAVVIGTVYLVVAIGTVYFVVVVGTAYLAIAILSASAQELHLGNRVWRNVANDVEEIR